MFWTSALTAVALLAAPLSAADADNYIQAWQDQTIHLDHRGQAFATVETSFVGNRVIVPGDRVIGRIEVINDGPTDGLLSVYLVPRIDTHGGQIANDRLAEHVDLFWSVNSETGGNHFAAKTALAEADPDGVVFLATVDAVQGEIQEITVGFEFPVTVSHSYSAGLASKELSFEVIVVIGGYLEEPGIQLPPPNGYEDDDDDDATPPRRPDTGDDERGAVAPPTRPTLPVTGAELGILIASGALVLVGLFLRRRNRDATPCPALVTAGDAR